MITRQMLIRSATLAVGAVLFAGCGEAPAPESVVIDARPVKLIVVSSGSDESRSRYPAVIDAGKVAELAFLVGGVIQDLPVSDAQQLDAGDLIAKLDPRDFQSKVNQAQATYANANEEFERSVRLAAQDAIATSVLEQREAQRDVAKAQLDSARKALADSVLEAPFSGVVANVPVREQQTVGSGATIATLINVETLDATINLPASVVSQVPGREDRGTIVLLDAAPDRELEAVFSEANLVADATSQTYAITFTFDAPEDMLVLPGMNATVVLRSSVADGGENPISVPLAAVQGDGKGQYVWVFDAQSQLVERRDIVVSPGIGESVVVASGLSIGEQIVGAGGAYLSEGLMVTPWLE